MGKNHAWDVTRYFVFIYKICWLKLNVCFAQDTSVKISIHYLLNPYCLCNNNKKYNNSGSVESGQGEKITIWKSDLEITPFLCWDVGVILVVIL